MSKFQVYKGTNDEFYFRLVAGNDQVVLSSEGYTDRSGCENGIDSVIKYSRDISKYKLKKSKNDKHYFVLRSGNNKVIGTGQMYSSKQAAEKGIDTVMNNVKGASIIENLT
jgi:uncharacterized protein YegP (UPF0339 family)